MSKEKQRHSNRRTQQDKSGRGKVKTRHESKTQAGMDAIFSEQAAASLDSDLSWFKPTEAQKEITLSMCCNELTAVQGSSGTGKSTTAIWQALQDLKRGMYDKILFIKTPNESGSDTIGYLSGDADQKLEVHFDAMRSIFHTFMKKEKLKFEEKRGRIEFTIPNFIQGRTFDRTLMIIDEMQSINRDTSKLLLERAGIDTRIVVLGDKNQRYSAKKRDDGFTDFVSRITVEDEDGELQSKEPTMGYIKLTAKDNMRSELSKRVVELYEEE